MIGMGLAGLKSEKVKRLVERDMAIWQLQRIACGII
jgi:hypothetical protein